MIGMFGESALAIIAISVAFLVISLSPLILAVSNGSSSSSSGDDDGAISPAEVGVLPRLLCDGALPVSEDAADRANRGLDWFPRPV